MALTFPSSPTNGQIYTDTVTGYRYIYNATAGVWAFSSNNVGMSVSSTPPGNVGSGSMWYNREIGRTFVYYDDGDSRQWVETVPATGSFDGTLVSSYANTAATVAVTPAYNTANAAYASQNADYTTTNAAFAKANTALQNTSGVVFAGDLAITGNTGIGTNVPSLFGRFAVYGNGTIQSNIVSNTTAQYDGAYFALTANNAANNYTQTALMHVLNTGPSDLSDTSFQIQQRTAGGAFVNNIYNYSYKYQTQQFFTSGIERMRIDTSGNMMVGTTSAYGKLSVSSNVATGGGAHISTADRTYSITNGSYLDLCSVSGMIMISNPGNGDTGLYLLGGRAVAYVSSTVGSWVTPTTSPAAGKTSVAYNAGSDSYRVYNNYGSTQSFFITYISSRNTI